jgi:hypothetical protein
MAGVDACLSPSANRNPQQRFRRAQAKQLADCRRGQISFPSVQSGTKLTGTGDEAHSINQSDKTPDSTHAHRRWTDESRGVSYPNEARERRACQYILYTQD